MKKWPLLSLLCWILLCSCEHKELCYDHHHFIHYVRVYIDKEIPNVTTGFYNEEYKRPTLSDPVVMRLILADPHSGRTLAERFLRNKGYDEHGAYFDGYINADPGYYKLLAYNFDTETSLITREGLWESAQVYTNEITAYLYDRIVSRTNTLNEFGVQERIVYEPDHFFVTDFGIIEIKNQKPNQSADTLTTIDGKQFISSTLVKSYYLQIQVEGLEYASSSVGLLTGMSGATWIANRKMDIENEVTVFFEMQPGQIGSSAGMKRNKNTAATLYTTFNTFGKLPDKTNKFEITFDFTTTYGKPYSETIDITELFSTPEAKEHQWLLINHTIKIPEPPNENGGSGLSPSVGEWEDVNKDIII